jgi:hypothetical protein
MWMFQFQQPNENLQRAAALGCGPHDLTGSYKHYFWEMRTHYQDSKKYNTYINKSVVPAVIGTILRSITIKETEKQVQFPMVQ